MAIAARQIAFGDAPERRERQNLAGLLGDTVEGEGRAAVNETVGDLTRRLNAKIRSGEFDPGTPRHDAVRMFLLDVAVQKLRESAPKYLEAEGME